MTTISRSADTRRWLVVMVLILLLAAGARIMGAATRPVWTDEGFTTWVTDTPDLHTILDRNEEWDRHPPLYFVWLRGWRSLAGESRMTLRFWAIAGGLLSAALVYRTGADWLDRRSGAYGALLFAVLDLAVYYGQEIRDYSWLVLAVCLMSLLFLRYLRRPRPWLLVAYTLSVALMLYTVYLGLLVVAVQGVIGLLIWRGSWRDKARLVAAWIAAALLFAPWLTVLVKQYDKAYNNVSVGITDFPGSYDTTFDTLVPLSELVFSSQLALGGGLYLLGVAALIRRRSRSVGWLAGAYLALAGGGLFVFMLVANLWIGLVAARTLVFLTPAVMLVAGYGLTQLEPRLQAIFGALAVIVLLATSPLIQPRLDSDRAAQAVAADYSRGDLVILETGWDDNAFKYELELALPDGASVIRTLPWTGDPTRAEPVVPHLIDTIRAYRRVWVVQWLQPSQVIPALESGADSFRRVQQLETPIGEQYQTTYVNDPVIQAVLFERSDLGATRAVFGDLLTLHDVVLSPTAAPGERLHVDLWWSAQGPLPRDYSVGVYLMPSEEDRVLAQHDGPPGGDPTTAWTPGTPVFDRHTLDLPRNLPSGLYRVVVSVYWHGDGEPLPVDGALFATVGEVRVS